MRCQFAISALLSVLPSFIAAQDTIYFGPNFALGPTTSWIREAETTLVLPAVPAGNRDRLALWPGMGTSGGDLIQALAVAFSDPAAGVSGQAPSRVSLNNNFPILWSAAYDLIEDTQLAGKQVPANAGTHVNIHYKFNDKTSNYDQTVMIAGKVVSTLSTSDGQAQGFGSAVECQDAACADTVLAHKYLNTTVILNAADKTFSNTWTLNYATSSGLSTTDKGKTWVVSEVDIQKYTFTET